ncbi:MAG: transcriptional repressor [Luteolibacter sp.]|jgi:Fur family peroxide stress response transcriptional regulator|nr:transcriptional repressor [Luteolibacter sp.]
MVSKTPDQPIVAEIPEEISGLRMTRQRQEIYRILIEQRDHPTANEVFMRAKDRLPNLSLATVYNCLEALVQHGIIRQVNFERESSRYCPNLSEHGHFHDAATGGIHDVDFKPGFNLADVLELPPGAVIHDVEITLRGKLPSP